MIVARILGEEYAFLFTKIIGTLEVLMAVWIISKINPRLCALTQIVVIAVMNTIEFILAPDLLLFAHINAIVAAGFILVIFLNEFVLKISKTRAVNNLQHS